VVDYICSRQGIDVVVAEPAVAGSDRIVAARFVPGNDNLVLLACCIQSRRGKTKTALRALNTSIGHVAQDLQMDAEATGMAFCQGVGLLVTDTKVWAVSCVGCTRAHSSHDVGFRSFCRVRFTSLLWNLHHLDSSNAS